MSLTHNTAHLKEALDKLLSQDWDKERIQYVIKAFADEGIQPLEDSLWSLFVGLPLDAAVGVQLDRLGKIVDLARAGLTDDAYRARLRAKIRVNRSFGQADDLLDVVYLTAPGATGVSVKDEPPAHVRVTAGSLSLDEISALEDFLALAKAAGVGLTFVYSTAAPSGTFSFTEYGATLPVLGDGTGFDDGVLSGAATA